MRCLYSSGEEKYRQRQGLRTRILERHQFNCGRRLRNWWPAAAIGAVATGVASYLVYNWLADKEEEPPTADVTAAAGTPSRRSHDATAQALSEHREADLNLQNHFRSIQRISDNTTLPQMLDELGMGLDRVANVDQLIFKLRQAGDPSGSGQAKAALWQELKVLTWARTMSCAWLVALADLLLRVQLNILGRHIFLQTHLLDPAQNGWGNQVHARKVTGRAQEMFIEYAHYLPEKASAIFCARMRSIVEQELGATDLATTMDVQTTLTHASRIHSAFEEWATEEGWVRLILPTHAEAAQYFNGFRTAPPDTGALGREFLELDEEVIQGMVDELHRVMRSARFSAAALAAVQKSASAVARQLQADVGQASIPLAKLLPRITAAGSALLQVRGEASSRWLREVGELPQVQELCASVYSCGPPP